MNRKAPRRYLSALLSAFILVIALSIFTLETIFSARNEFRPLELDYIRAAFIACSVALTALVVVSSSLPPKLAMAARAVTGVFFAATVFSINWSMVEDFVLLPAYAMAGLCLLAAYLTYIVLSLGNRGRSVVAALVVLILILGPVRGMLNAQEDEDSSEFPGVEDVTFETKPNIYFIVFDSIHPKSLTSRYMGIEETAFQETFYARMDRFENLFSARVPTKSALNLMLRMEVDEFDRATPESLELFRGKYDGRLNAIFRNNDYEINTSYYGTYFGIEQGRYVDRYHTSQTTSACTFNDSKFRQVSLFGLCRFIDKKDASTTENGKDTAGSGRDKWPQADHLLNFVSYLSRQNKPQFLLANIYTPGHTKKDFVIENEKAVAAFNDYYQARSSQAQRVLNKLLDQLEREDPTAILYIFGDHGPWRSRGNWEARFEEDPVFFVHDRFGILGGVFPKGRCSTYVDMRNDQSYSTSIQGAEAILKCVTEGRYQELDQDYIIERSPDGVSDKFGNYVYE